MQEFVRKCPICELDIYYKNKNNLNKAIKNNSKCHPCRYKNMAGDKNPFYGKTHKQETLDKIKQTKSEREYPVFQSETFRQKMSDISKNNKIINGRSTYEILIDTYGDIEGELRYKEAVQKWRKSSSGKNNPMYGKPTPKKAGNGWSGWYKGQFFRSLRELSYIVTVLEPSGKEWKSAESIRIPYKNYDGSERTYSPDFICDGQLIEIKPERLINSTLVKLKTSAATEYCQKNNMEFIIIDCPILEIDKITLLINNELVKLTNITMDKYRKMINEYK